MLWCDEAFIVAITHNANDVKIIHFKFMFMKVLSKHHYYMHKSVRASISFSVLTAMKSLYSHPQHSHSSSDA